MGNSRRRGSAASAAGFTLIEVMISIVIICIVAAGVAASYKRYLTSMQLVRSSQKVAELEQQLPSLIWASINSYLDNQAAMTPGACNLAGIPAALDHVAIGRYGSISSAAPVYSSPGPNAVAALARCSNPNFPADTDLTHLYFCMQLSSNTVALSGIGASETFFGSKVEAFIEIAVSFRDVTMNVPVSCQAYNNGNVGAPGQVAQIFTSVYWHHMPLQGNASEKQRDLVFYGVQSGLGNVLAKAVVPELASVSPVCADKPRRLRHKFVASRGRKRFKRMI